MPDLAALFGQLHRQMNRAFWGPATCGGAPHKPLLLLALCDLFETKALDTDIVPACGPVLLSLGEHFSSYWHGIIHDRRGDMLYPFWYMKSEPFWTLLPLPRATALTGIPGSFIDLAAHFIGAKIAPEAYSILCDSDQRDVVRETIITIYFDAPTQDILRGLVRYSREADSFQDRLLELTRQGKIKVRESLAPYVAEVEIRVRDQGFRIAVRKAYDHRCAACGIRVMTPDGHTLVEGAHIRPWSETQDDRIANGLSLCRTCHWAFDDGLWTVSNQHKIETSPALSWSTNIPVHLAALDRRELIPPLEAVFSPDDESLKWHRENYFRRA
jgi:putative restriction endonuclease